MNIKNANIERIGVHFEKFKKKIPIRLYKHDGQLGASVSTAMSMIVPLELQDYYKLNSPKKLQKRRDETAGSGSVSHDLINRQADGEIITPDEEQELWWGVWEDVQKKYKVSAEMTEFMVFSKVFGYGGQVDRCGVFDCNCPQCQTNLPKSKRAIIDLKTGWFSFMDLWKTEAYRQAYIEMTGDYDIGTIVLYIPRKELLEKGHEPKHFSIVRHTTCFLNFLCGYQDFCMNYHKQLLKLGMNEKDVYAEKPFILYEREFGEGSMKDMDEMARTIERNMKGVTK